MLFKSTQVFLLMMGVMALAFVFLTFSSNSDTIKPITVAGGTESNVGSVAGARAQQGPITSTPDFNMADINQKPSELKSTELKPTELKPTEQEPAEQKPAEQKPAEQKPTEQKSTGQKPTEQESQEKPAVQTTELVSENPKDQNNGPTHNFKNKAGDALQPMGNKIVILTAADGRGHNTDIQGLFEMVTSNREEYCNYHGMCFFNDYLDLMQL